MAVRVARTPPQTPANRIKWAANQVGHPVDDQRDTQTGQTAPKSQAHRNSPGTRHGSKLLVRTRPCFLSGKNNQAAEFF